MTYWVVETPDGDFLKDCDEDLYEFLHEYDGEILGVKKLTVDNVELLDINPIFDESDEIIYELVERKN